MDKLKMITTTSSSANQANPTFLTLSSSLLVPDAGLVDLTTQQRAQGGGRYRRGTAGDDKMPMANIVRIMRRVIPMDAKIAEEAKDLIQSCLTLFIQFLTHEANEHCQSHQRNTVNGDDVIWAARSLGFDAYLHLLCLELRNYRESQRKLVVSPEVFVGPANRRAPPALSKLAPPITMVRGVVGRSRVEEMLDKELLRNYRASQRKLVASPEFLLRPTSRRGDSAVVPRALPEAPPPPDQVIMVGGGEGRVEDEVMDEIDAWFSATGEGDIRAAPGGQGL